MNNKSARSGISLWIAPLPGEKSVYISRWPKPKSKVKNIWMCNIHCNGGAFVLVSYVYFERNPIKGESNKVSQLLLVVSAFKLNFPDMY